MTILFKKASGLERERKSPSFLLAACIQKNIFCAFGGADMGVIHYELLDRGVTITANLYSSQLLRADSKLRENFPALLANGNPVFLHDNARPHVATSAVETLTSIGRDVLPHPPYSPDLAPSDYHLFRSLKSHFSGTRHVDQESLVTHLTKFFASKPPEFFVSGIDSLITRWSMVKNSGGEYIMKM
jgi:histone-lysine N-methyltransferase SETMAR